MLTTTFTTAANYPAVPQIGPNAEFVRIDLIITGPVIVELWSGAHGQATPIGEVPFQQSASISACVAIRVKDATAGTHVSCTVIAWQTKDPLPTYIGVGASQVSTVPTGALIGVQAITALGAGTYTPSATATAIVVEVVGAGGGGGGTAVGASAATAAAGGAAGGYGRSYITPLAASYAYSVGTGGSGGNTAPGNGTAGGNTTFGPITANGGSLGGGAASGVQAEGSGGQSCAGATLNLQGGDGQGGANSRGGEGGASFFGGGGRGAVTQAGQGRAKGSGGGGGTGPAAQGGNGADGLIIIYEYA